jgi:hypothetical protein
MNTTLTTCSNGGSEHASQDIGMPKRITPTEWYGGNWKGGLKARRTNHGKVINAEYEGGKAGLKAGRTNQGETTKEVELVDVDELIAEGVALAPAVALAPPAPPDRDAHLDTDLPPRDDPEYPYARSIRICALSFRAQVLHQYMFTLMGWQLYEHRNGCRESCAGCRERQESIDYFELVVDELFEDSKTVTLLEAECLDSLEPPWSRTFRCSID